MKKQLLATFIFCLPFMAFSQMVRLKKISSIEKNLINNQVVTKTHTFEKGKLIKIQTSDVVQSFFYNENGLLEHTVKERIGSSWKEVANYYYNANNQLIKHSNKYQDGPESAVETVTFKYEGSRITAITTRTDSKVKFSQYLEYVVEDGVVVRETERNLNQDIIQKRELYYYKENFVRSRGFVGDKSSDTYMYDSNNSVKMLIAESLFGENFMITVPLIGIHEREIGLDAMSKHNLTKFQTSSATKMPYEFTYTYDAANYPKTAVLINDNKDIKTDITFEYEN